MSARAGNLYAWLVLIAAVIISDQIAKWVVLNTPVFNARDCLDITVPCGKIELSPVFDLTMLWNRGISFGTFQSDGLMRWVLVGATTVISVAFAIWLVRADRRLTALSLSLVIGGAIGNLIDRIRFGAVVDFLDFSGLFFPWVFNIADAAITVGALLLFLDQFLMSRQGARKDERANES